MRNNKVINEAIFNGPSEATPSLTIGEAMRGLQRDPSQFIRHWNYKGAVLSGMLRAPIFLISYLIGKEGLKLAVGAAVVQFAFRFAFAGIGGALIQSFRRVEPPWKALVTILLTVPLISHVFEFGVQAAFAYLTGTDDHTDEVIVRSICVSVISSLFTLYIMRRNVMIVGEAESKSLLSDVMRLPVLIFDFMAFIPNEIALMFRRGAYLAMLIAIAAFGVFSQMLVWAVTGKAFWTYGGGKQFALLKYWGFDGVILLVIAIIGSMLMDALRRARRTTGR